VTPIWYCSWTLPIGAMQISFLLSVIRRLLDSSLLNRCQTLKETAVYTVRLSHRICLTKHVLYLTSFNIQLHLIQCHKALHLFAGSTSWPVMVICFLLFILQLPASEFELLLLNIKSQIQLLTLSCSTSTYTVASRSALGSGVLEVYVGVVMSGVSLMIPATSCKCWKEDFILLNFFGIRLARSILMYERMIRAVLCIGVCK